MADSEKILRRVLRSGIAAANVGAAITATDRSGKLAGPAAAAHVRAVCVVGKAIIGHFGVSDGES